MAAKTKKRVNKISRIGASDKLLRWSGKYLQACGGSALVAGPISIMSFPGEAENNFYLAIKILGRKPEKGKLA